MTSNVIAQRLVLKVMRGLFTPEQEQAIWDFSWDTYSNHYDLLEAAGGSSVLTPDLARAYEIFTPGPKSSEEQVRAYDRLHGIVSTIEETAILVDVVMELNPLHQAEMMFGALL